MGNTQGSDAQNNIKIEHPRFAKAKITKNNKMVLQYKYNHEYINNIKRMPPMDKHKKIPLIIPTVYQTQAENFCGIEKSINLIYDLHKFTLYQEIIRRKKLKLNFQQTQLWFLLYYLTYGSSIFQKIKQKSGDIRPKNILIDEKGDVSIVNILTFPDEFTNYYKSLNTKEKTYLAPQQLAELQNGVKYCKSDPVIAESFSIGLTVIDAALLFNSEDLYDYVNIAFQNHQFQDNLVAFKSLNFSPFFIKTVLNMLQVQCFNRPTPGQVLAIMKPYQKEILDLIQFVPDRQKSRKSLQDFQMFKS